MRYYPPNKNAIDTEIVANGQSIIISRKRFIPVREIVQQALRSLHFDADLSRWRIQNANGEEVCCEMAIGDYDDDILFAVLPPGVSA